MNVFTPTNVILGLKIAVSAVTVLLALALIAIITGRRKLHGRINYVFFALTLGAVVFFEIIIRVINPTLTAEFTPEQRDALNRHLWFAIPSAVFLPVMLLTGRSHSKYHLPFAFFFLVFWIGTFVTGVFTLPHQFGE